MILVSSKFPSGFSEAEKSTAELYTLYKNYASHVLTRCACLASKKFSESSSVANFANINGALTLSVLQHYTYMCSCSKAYMHVYTCTCSCNRAQGWVMIGGMRTKYVCSCNKGHEFRCWFKCTRTCNSCFMVFTVYGICTALVLYVLPRAEPEEVHTALARYISHAL